MSKHSAQKSAHEGACFFIHWLKAPRMIGAVAPSSKHLAHAMAQQLESVGNGPVIELGAGTGSVTAGLLKAGIAPDRLIVIERDENLCRTLKSRFPQLQIVQGDAGKLRSLLTPLGITSVAAIVSSLPLVSLPAIVRDAVMTESLALMDKDAPFIQFTYSLAAPMDYRDYGFAGKMVARVWRNFPPASVWRFERCKANA
jgi:phosphatidylethanolamine/phosphatidyl-N-methylethanolamine N-methyltransferase